MYHCVHGDQCDAGAITERAKGTLDYNVIDALGLQR